ncbi:MAG: hypothetical protein GXX96_14250 [Planctomycetaceae bacterium]|nr:hypothetical protein [Planctomycetaceae bacterium]
MANPFKNPHRGLLLESVLLVVTFLPVQILAADSPIPVGSRLELFVDRHLVDRMEGVEFRTHPPQMLPLPKSPLIGGYATVIKDGDLYRGYYRDTDPSYTGPQYSGHPGEITCYAESRDGHEWTFPSLGLFDVNGSRENNVVLARQPPFSHNFSPFLDTRPGVVPDERFKALAGHPGKDRKAGADGLHAFASADGVVWRPLGQGPVIPYDKAWSHAFDSQNVAFWSAAEQRYVCYFRTWETPHGRLRTVSRSTSADFLTWDKPVPMHPNLPGEHLYTSQTHPYFRAPHIYIALPTRYVAGRVGGEKTDPMLGSTDIVFMATRAGATSYERLFPEAYIRPGLDPDRWGSRSNYVALNVVPTGDAEMSIYHAKSGHRYVLRTDGFVSVAAGIKQGELVTKPLVFEGNRLVVNYSTSAAGSLAVEIQTPDGTSIPGFSLADCNVVVGDTVAGCISWRGNPDLEAWAGKPVRLRLVMTECDVYSFKFEPKPITE